ncbi:MAG: tRNA pseudouridine(38-40) synthase TruA [Bacteroidota bacterium]
MPRYFIQLAYNGASFNGWQIQENTPNTVQQVLQEKLSMILSETIEVVGCGRTDTGVHAKDYYAHFDSLKTDLHSADSNCVYKLNKVLPYEIAVKGVFPVKDDASARFDAEFRSYEYLLHTYKDPFLTAGSLLFYGDLNFNAMNDAAAHLLTVTDFTSFSKVNTQTKTNNCNIIFAEWRQINSNQHIFKITANRFLQNMVRAIVGTLLEVGKGKITLEEFKTIIANKNRSDAGMSVAGHALYLTEIQYPTTIFNG